MIQPRRFLIAFSTTFVPKGRCREFGDPSLSNQDLRPTPPEQRSWGFYNYMALWFSMCMEITTYQLASSLIAKGMDWKQAVGTVLLGNLIVLVPLLLNAHAGAKYGIPFPVFIRAPFGVRGANIAAMLRAVVACGWFGIQSWIGGTAIHAMLGVIWPGARGKPGVLWVCFLGFWLLNMVVVWRGVDSIRRLQAFGAPFMFVMAAALLIWVRMKAGSFGTMLSTPSQFHSTSEFLAVFFPSLTAMVGYWATLALNIPDFTRYSKSQSAQSWGQALGSAGGDGAVHVCGHRGDVGFGGAVRPRDLESDRADRAVPSASGGVCGHDRHPGGDAEREHRRECGFAVERFFESVSAADQLQDGRTDYGLSGTGDVPVEAAGYAGCVYFWLAGRATRGCWGRLRASWWRITFSFAARSWT